MTRIALLTLFLAFTATSGNIARLKERTEAVDVDVPFARLGQEDGTRLAKIEPTDEDPLPLLVELEPVEDEADDGADLDSYEEDVDESHPTPDVLVDEENGEVVDGEKTGRASGRIQRRKGGRREKRIKKTQEKNGDMEQTDEVKLFSKLRQFEDEDKDLLEELDVSDDESTDNEEEELLVQSGGRHRFRQRRRQGGNRGADKRSRLSRRRSFIKLRTEKNNKARRFKKVRKNNEEKIKKVQYADKDIEYNEGRRHGRRNGAAKKNGGRHVKGGRRLDGAAGGCKKSSMICCDGSAPTWRRSSKGWHKKMTCKNGDKPVCFVDQCHYTVLDYFVSLI